MSISPLCPLPFSIMTHYILTTAGPGWAKYLTWAGLSRVFTRRIVFINQTFKASPGSRYKLTDARLATAWAVHSLSPGRLVASTDILRVFALIALIFIEYIQDHKIANLDFIPVFIERTIFCVVKYFAILNEWQWIGLDENIISKKTLTHASSRR